MKRLYTIIGWIRKTLSFVERKYISKVYKGLFYQTENAIETNFVLDLNKHGRHLYYLIASINTLKTKIIIVGNSELITIVIKVVGRKRAREKCVYVKKLEDIDVNIRGKCHLITDRKNMKKIQTMGFSKILEINYNYYTKTGNDVIHMPYFQHYSSYMYGMGNKTSRKYRNLYPKILFAGTINSRAYSKCSFFKVLSRAEIFEILFNNFKEEITYISQKKDLVNLNNVNSILIIATQNLQDVIEKHILNRKQYISLLQNCDFFISPPGVVMPSSHNIIEAMSEGAIPVFNYSKYFYPELTNGTNCFEFNTEAELIKLINEIISLEKSEIDKMKKNVKLFYDTNLSPESFGKKINQIERNSIILVNDEANSVEEFIDICEG